MALPAIRAAAMPSGGDGDKSPLCWHGTFLPTLPGHMIYTRVMWRWLCWLRWWCFLSLQLIPVPVQTVGWN